MLTLIVDNDSVVLRSCVAMGANVVTQQGGACVFIELDRWQIVLDNVTAH